MSGRGSQYKSRLGSAADGIRCFFGAHSKGYTVVEVMIFLAVTTALFVMIIGTFTGRQARAEFSTAAREMESRLQDIANDVSTGTYNKPDTFSCSVNLSRVPQLVSGSDPQGNKDCTFIGRVAQFAVSGDTKQYNLFTAVGSRLGSDGKDTDELGEANPRALNLPGLGLVEGNSLPVGLVMHSMWSDDGAGNRTRISAVGFFTTFGSGPSGESSLNVDIVPLGDGNDSEADIVTAISGITSASAKNPNGGILICMNGDATDQHAVLQLGSDRGRLTTDVEIKDGACTSTGD